MTTRLLLAFAALLSAGCAAVKPYEREKLADPILDPAFAQSKRQLQHKFLSTREGAMGGPVAVGGGCGCAK
ncbi:MAG TPA: DUF4266 domain-containing protein [Fibrobacteria bacterium]|nr:DUF4266 domain-containing protein [Fibrobacteria bacterium]